MHRNAIGLAVVLGIAVGTAAVAVAAAPPVTKGDADRFQRKLFSIYRNSRTPEPAPQRTPISENEVNAYFRFYAADQLPPGVVDPEVSIHGLGRLSGRATINLDAIKETYPDSWAGALTFLTGDRLPVVATGTLHTEEGIGRFEVESVAVSGLAVPKAILQQLVTLYSRTPDHPEGIRLDDPFKLPARIREIEVEEGRIVIVQ